MPEIADGSEHLYVASFRELVAASRVPFDDLHSSEFRNRLDTPRVGVFVHPLLPDVGRVVPETGDTQWNPDHTTTRSFCPIVAITMVDVEPPDS